MPTDKALVYLPPVNGLPGIEERHLRRLRETAPDLEWIACSGREQMGELLPEACAALVWAFSSQWEDRARNLRLVATPAAGRDWIHIKPRPGLTLSFGSFHGQLMAETVLGLMLAFARGIKDSMDRRDEVWPRVEIGGAMRPLRGSHAVILGFGHIGKWVARLLAPLGVRVTGVNRSNTERPDFLAGSDRVVTLAELDGVLPTADHLVVVLPGAPESEGVVDARRLSLLRKDAFLYNVGRGNAVDMAALAAALESGNLAGAGLDVFPVEPLPGDAPIRRCRKAILMPHVSAFAPNYMDLWLDEFLPRLRDMLPN